jgi:RimJ/RimL family protein N-acetyltransferase
LEGERDVLLAVKNVRGTLGGFFLFRGAPGLCVIGLGMVPALTGRSLGAGLVRAGLDFARRQWGVSRFCLDVVAFDRCATAVCRRLGFVTVGRYSRSAPELGGEVVKSMRLEAGVDELG